MRIRGLRAICATLLIAGLAAACAPRATRSSEPTGASTSALPAPTTALVMVSNAEVKSLAAKAVGPLNPARTTRLFNAGLTIQDSRGDSRPYLAEAIPELNSPDWIAFPDGRMETTWRLRPDLTWHDGQPLTAEDFAFAFDLYTAAELAPLFDRRPQALIDRVAAVDARTIRISWRSPYLFTGLGLDPLPRHLLAEPFSTFGRDPASQRDALMGLHFWTTAYVGAGPYRLTTWEPGAYLEGDAFPGHALGKPKIDRVRMRFISDENTVLTNMLTGDAHFVTSNMLGFEQAMTLKRQGGFNDAEQKGKLIFITSAMVMTVFQHRPEYLRTTAFSDLRVRKAMVYATDKEAINQGLYEGEGFVGDTPIRREAPYLLDVERAIMKYPYDPRGAEQLLNEAGYARGRDGMFADISGQPFQPAGLWANVGAQREQLFPIMVDGWQRAGIDIQPSMLPNALMTDLETQATFPGLVIYGINLPFEGGGAQTLATEQIPTPANRWAGVNRGGWSNAGYDALWERFNTSLVQADRIQAVVDMMRMQSELVPSFPMYYLFTAMAHAASLKGPESDTASWNIHEWEWTL